MRGSSLQYLHVYTYKDRHIYTYGYRYKHMDVCTYIYIYTYTYVYTHTSIHLSTYLSIYLPTYLSTRLSTYRSIYLSMYLCFWDSFLTATVRTPYGGVGRRSVGTGCTTSIYVSTHLPFFVLCFEGLGIASQAWAGGPRLQAQTFQKKSVFFYAVQ